MKKSISLQLIAMMIPLVVILIIATLYLGINNSNTFNESKQIYYDEIASIESALITIDRDMYQAQLDQEMGYRARLSGKDISENISGYDENIQQVRDGIIKVQGLFESDPFLYNEYKAPDQSQTNAELFAGFSETFEAWTQTYNLTNGQGDFKAQHDVFDGAREYLNELQVYMAEYAEFKSDDLHAEIRMKLIVAIVVVLIAAIICVILTISVAGNIAKAVVSTKTAFSSLADGDLTTEVDGILYPPLQFINHLPKILFFHN